MGIFSAVSVTENTIAATYRHDIAALERFGAEMMLQIVTPPHVGHT
jgi:hypothetical protein